jgi:hypothetical protein
LGPIWNQQIWNQGSILAKKHLERAMKKRNLKAQLAVLLFASLCFSTSTHAQLTPSGDAYTNTADPTTNYGSKTLLDVQSAAQTTYIQFDLSAIPSGYTGANIAKASLKLYVNAVTKAGSFNVDYINGPWSEGTIDASNAPALGTTIAASVPLVSATKNQYILIDITSAVQAWLNGTEPNNGIALVGNSPLNATFDSKESTTTSHAAELDIVFAGGGTLTGITTANGSGLTGGGTSGTLNLSLSNTCATNQVLQWNGTSWSCASVGAGSVTSVGSGAGLTGGPITTSGTLSIAAAGVTNPMLQNSSVTVSAGTGLSGGGAVALGGSTSLSVNSAVVPELAAANTFTSINAVSVNSSSPALTLANSGGPGLDISSAHTQGIYINSAGGDGIHISSAGGYGIYASGGADGGYFTGPTGGSLSVNDTDTNFSVGAYGDEFGATKATFGLWGYSASTGGVGTYGQSQYASKVGAGSVGESIGVWGDSGSGVGVYATADNNVGLVAFNNSGAPTADFQNASTLTNALVLYTQGGAGGYCKIDGSGNLTCTGGYAAAVPAAGGSRKVALNTIGSPEHWFEDAGSGQLSNGAAVVNIESVFGETVNTGVDYHVFLTPKGDCKGLYVAQESATSFVVRELGGGTSSLAFDYRIMAKRKGFEQLRLVDKTSDINASLPERTGGERTPMPTAQEIRKAHEAHLHAAHPAIPALKTK